MALTRTNDLYREKKHCRLWNVLKKCDGTDEFLFPNSRRTSVLLLRCLPLSIPTPLSLQCHLQFVSTPEHTHTHTHTHTHWCTSVASVRVQTCIQFCISRLMEITASEWTWWGMVEFLLRPWCSSWMRRTDEMCLYISSHSRSQSHQVTFISSFSASVPEIWTYSWFLLLKLILPFDLCFLLWVYASCQLCNINWIKCRRDVRCVFWLCGRIACQEVWVSFLWLISWLHCALVR